MHIIHSEREREMLFIVLAPRGSHTKRKNEEEENRISEGGENDGDDNVIVIIAEAEFLYTSGWLQSL